MFATTGPHQAGGPKNSLANIRETREFVANLATWPLREAVNLSSAPAPATIDEFELAGVTKAAARIVRAPYVDESPVHLECVLTQIIELPTPDPTDPHRRRLGRSSARYRHGVIRDGGSTPSSTRSPPATTSVSASSTTAIRAPRLAAALRALLGQPARPGRGSDQHQLGLAGEASRPP
jgi:hypothetical protein